MLMLFPLRDGRAVAHGTIHSHTVVLPTINKIVLGSKLISPRMVLTVILKISFLADLAALKHDFVGCLIVLYCSIFSYDLPKTTLD